MCSVKQMTFSTEQINQIPMNYVARIFANSAGGQKMRRERTMCIQDMAAVKSTIFELTPS